MTWSSPTATTPTISPFATTITFLPDDEIFETVDFNYETNLVTISKGNRIVKLTKDNKNLYIALSKLQPQIEEFVNKNKDKWIKLVLNASNHPYIWQNQIQVEKDKFVQNDHKISNTTREHCCQRGAP